MRVPLVTRRFATTAPLVMGAVVAASALMLTPFAASPALAEPSGSYDARATAYGVDASFYNAQLPLGIAYQGSGPVAEAQLNSLGDSAALASFPYPGDVVAGLPGTAGALYGVPIPQYPLYVRSQSGDAPQTGGFPGVSLEASSFPQLATGRAAVGTDLAGFVSDARVNLNSDDSITSRAVTTLGTNILNAVKLSGVESVASVTASSTGELTKTSGLSISRISVPGLAITIPPTSPTSAPLPVPIPGAPQAPPIEFPPFPLPFGGETLVEPKLGFENGVFVVTIPSSAGTDQKYAVPAGSVLDAFKAQGFTVSYQAARESKSGIIAPVLSFATQLPALPENGYLDGPYDVVFDIGRATASVDFRPLPAGGSDFGGTAGGSLGGAAGGVAGAPGSGLTDAAGLPASLPGTVPGAVPGVGGTLPDTAGVGGSSSLPTGDQVQLLGAESMTEDVSGLFLLGLIVAGAVLVSAVAIRTVVVR